MNEGGRYEDVGVGGDGVVEEELRGVGGACDVQDGGVEPQGLVLDWGS